MTRGETLTNYRSNFTGCTAEYVAASYFLTQGQPVYWPAVQQGADDFVVRSPAGYRRVQVKLASWVTMNKHRWLRCRPTSSDRPAFEEYDLLAVVHGENLWVIPAPLITTQCITLFKSNPNAAPSQWERFRKPIFAITGDTTGEPNGKAP